VRDWHVPVPLVNLRRTREQHWDLAVAKVIRLLTSKFHILTTILQICDYIDGVNHVGRIAALADCDTELAREAIAHLL
jgi:hypothetical protein